MLMGRTSRYFNAFFEDLAKTGPTEAFEKLWKSKADILNYEKQMKRQKTPSNALGQKLEILKAGKNVAKASMDPAKSELRIDPRKPWSRIPLRKDRCQSEYGHGESGRNSREQWQCKVPLTQSARYYTPNTLNEELRISHLPNHISLSPSFEKPMRRNPPILPPLALDSSKQQKQLCITWPSGKCDAWNVPRSELPDVTITCLPEGGPKTPLQTVIDHLCRSSTDGYTHRMRLTGARPLFNSKVYSSKVSGFPENDLNQLSKRMTDELNKIVKIVKKWTGDNEVYIWISSSLHEDLSLPTDSHPIGKCMVQLVVLAEERPAIYLMVCDDHTKQGRHDQGQPQHKTTQSCVVEFARVLKSSLLNVCHCDFVLLPCELDKDSLLHNENALDEEVNKQFKFSRRYFRGPQKISASTLKELKHAMTVVAGLSCVPFLLPPLICDESQDCVLLLDDDWRKAVFLIIEALAGDQDGDDCHIYYTELNERKVKIAVIEAAKRLSFRNEVVIVCPEEEIHECVRSMAQKVKREHELDMKLKTVESAGLPELPSEPKYIMYINSPRADLSKRSGSRILCVDKITQEFQVMHTPDTMTGAELVPYGLVK